MTKQNYQVVWYDADDVFHTLIFQREDHAVAFRAALTHADDVQKIELYINTLDADGETIIDMEHV